MGTKHKNPDVLDEMIEHIRYEVMQIIEFRMFGNEWCDLLRDDLGGFATAGHLGGRLDPLPVPDRVPGRSADQRSGDGT